MRIVVKAKTGAKVVGVKKVGDLYQVAVKEAPVGGKANEAIINALAEYFNIAKARINLISGQTSKQKIFEIL